MSLQKFFPAVEAIVFPIQNQGKWIFEKAEQSERFSIDIYFVL